MNLRLIRRRLRHLWQRLTRGWSDRDTWGLDQTTAGYLIPRLERFRELTIGHPVVDGIESEEDWDAVLGEMIYGLSVCRDGWGSREADFDRAQRGLEMFGRYFRNLWW